MEWWGAGRQPSDNSSQQPAAYTDERNVDQIELNIYFRCVYVLKPCDLCSFVLRALMANVRWAPFSDFYTNLFAKHQREIVFPVAWPKQTFADWLY